MTRRSSSSTLRYGFGASLVSLISLYGCGVDATPDSSLFEPFAQLDPDAPADFDENGLNDDFLSAEPLRVDVDEIYTVRGVIESGSDVDVFDLGAVRSGDRVVAELFIEGTSDGGVALFDENGHSLLVNDERNSYLGRSGPYVDIVFRRSGSHSYLAASASPKTKVAGPYTLAIQKTSGAPLPTPRPQTVLLNFHGAQDIGFGGRPAIDIPAFDAADISPTYENDTLRIAEWVTRWAREDFEGFDVEIRSTHEGYVDDGQASIVHFGAYDPQLLGVAEAVDEYNQNTRQDAIIFVETFAAFTPLNPSAEEIAQALANVTSHEIGHLLGLVHTQDYQGVMDITATLSQMLNDQYFKISPFHSTIFITGLQNAPLYLLDSVGGDPAALNKAVPAKWRSVNLKRQELLHARPELDHREGWIFSSCAHENHLVQGGGPRFAAPQGAVEATSATSVSDPFDSKK